MQLLCIVFFQLIATLSYGQDRLITGIVTDDGGVGLPGVSVKLKNSQLGTMTITDGKFSIKIPPKTADAILVLSYIGYNTTEVPVGDKKTLTVILRENVSSLTEVVIAYGSAKKSDLTGAVGVVNMKDFEKAPVKSLDEALAGRVAGVQVVSPDGQPGNNGDIIVRGVGTFGSAGPLYVIDGFPQEGNAFNNINPNDIESITVLKDASSTAIYGARGANGVIIITTKRGKAGLPVINYNGYAGFQKVTSKMDLMDAYEYVRLQAEIAAALNSSAVTTFVNTSYFSDGKTLDDYKNVKGIDWQDKMYTNAPYMSHSLSISGRSNSGLNYFVSGNLTDQNGLIINSGFKRYQGRVTLEQSFNEKLKVGLITNYSATSSFGTVTSTQTPAVGTNANTNNAQFNLMFNIWAYRPVGNNGTISGLEDDFYDFGSTDAGSARVNPYITTLNELDEKRENNLSANAYIDYEITKGLKLKVTGGVTNISSGREVFHNSLTRGGAPVYSYGAINPNGQNGGINSGLFQSYLNENTLTYSKKIYRDHDLNFLAGFTTQKSMTKGNGFNAINVPNENLGVSGLDEGTLTGSATSYSSMSTMMSYFGRANYNYKNKYFLTGTIRADGSSKFAPGNKWGYFPSGGVSWQLGREKFMQGFKNFLSEAKVRASYGLTGNNRVSDFAYESELRILGSTRTIWNNQAINGLGVQTIYNPNLTWETASTLDMGLELSFLKNKLNLEVGYYNKKTIDLLLNSTISSNSGFTSANQNIGNIRNTGLEISLNSTNVSRGSFYWNTSFNISFNRNRLLALSSNQESRIDNSTSGAFSADFSTGFYIAKLGQPVAQFYGYVYDGLYQVGDFDVSANGIGSTYALKDGVPYYTASKATTQPGDIKLKDLNGDGFINANDATVIGSPLPIHIGGISNNFGYKGFDLNVFFQWSYGNDVFNANRVRMEGLTTGDLRSLGLNMFATYADRWNFDNQEAKYQRVNANGIRYFTTNYVEDASFLRLKTVSLSYSIPEKLLKNIKLGSAKVYLTGQNLYTWTKYTGPDPEVSTRNSALTPGFDYSPYPRTRVIVFGANITF
ncbi:TonB-dependent receptor [Pedobacter sp. MC2016-24]|uniref:SusC/RagA family TonB-linked outer membrane protein n=1 Tax=Pedobacter sp. MC2016-24 TaxID=2780090 RepID=UPI001D15ED78|nr:TonB-dependent receptor [Pedobacter sp. MC2016-24]